MTTSPVPTPPRARLRLFAMLFGRHCPEAPGWNAPYARSLVLTGLGCKAITMGPLSLPQGTTLDRAPAGAPPLELVDKPVNIVAALPLMTMGRPLSERDLAGAARKDPKLRTVVGVKAPNEVVYRPETMLGGLATTGLRNVAITAPVLPPGMKVDGPMPAMAEELRHLVDRYDQVWVPSQRDKEVLEGLGFPRDLALVVEPDDVARMLYLLTPLMQVAGAAAADLALHPTHDAHEDLAPNHPAGVDLGGEGG